jgi:hypothetical protein
MDELLIKINSVLSNNVSINEDDNEEKTEKLRGIKFKQLFFKYFINKKFQIINFFLVEEIKNFLKKLTEFSKFCYENNLILEKDNIEKEDKINNWSQNLKSSTKDANESKENKEQITPFLKYLINLPF